MGRCSYLNIYFNPTSVSVCAILKLTYPGLGLKTQANITIPNTDIKLKINFIIFDYHFKRKVNIAYNNLLCKYSLL